MGFDGLHQEGWSQRRIAEALGIDRKTVRRQLASEAAKGAKAPTGSGGPDEEESGELAHPCANASNAANQLDQESEKILAEKEEDEQTKRGQVHIIDKDAESG